ncbi:MAG: RHS repeat-associated core domain-containing protein [Gemmataceae bacterium]
MFRSSMLGWVTRSPGKSAKMQQRRTMRQSQPSLEHLEDRTTPALLFWDGEGADHLWNTASNWSTNTLPTSSDDVVIDVPGQVTVTLTSGAVSVRALISQENLTLDGGSELTVLYGTSQVAGTLILDEGASLGAEGVGTTFTAMGSTQIDGASLRASGGATLALPNVTSYAALSGGRTFSAEGAGSLLDLSAMLTLTGSPLDGGFAFGHVLQIQATAGAHIDLSSALSILDPLEGNGINRRLIVSASGADSLIDLSSLTTLRDSSPASDYISGLSYLAADDGAEVRAPLLTQLAFTDVVLAGASSILPIAQFSSITGGSLSVSGDGNERTFTNLTSIEKTSLLVSPNARLRLPGVVSTSIDGQTWQWSGGILDLPALKSVSMSDGNVDLSGFTLDTLTQAGGQVTAMEPLTIQQALAWSGGYLVGSSKVILEEGATGVILGTTPKFLGVALENSGQLTYLGTGLSFGIESLAGTITNRAGKTFTLVGDGDIDIAFDNTNHAIINQGNLIRYGEGTTRVAVPVQVTGGITVQQGILELAGSNELNLAGSSYINLLASATLRTNSSINGSTTNADLFTVPGTLILSGGTLAAPHFLEAMGTDRGTTFPGYVRNFAVGSLRLEAAYVKLRDIANNASGAGAEAIYVDTLTVPAGSTLDLNGVMLFARATEIQGVVIGGEVTLVTDGGSLALNAPTFGSIQDVGEADDWGFFGRAGQRISVTVNPGPGGNPSPVAPTLGFVEVQIVTSSGQVIAFASNELLGVPVTLTLESLPVSGNYFIRVQAPPEHETSTGNYLLTGYDASIDTAPLILNEPMVGLLENTRSFDRWTFTGVANQQVRFDLVNTAFPGPRFSLLGQGGWVGFLDLDNDSGLVTLPSDGTYWVQAGTDGSGYGSYAFRLNLTSQTALTLGNSYTGVLPEAGSAQLFAIDVPESTPLNVLLEAASTAGVEIYLKKDSAPTLRSFDYQGGNFGPAQSVLVPFASPGRWYVLVYSGERLEEISFTLRADATAVLVRGVSPSRGQAGKTTTLTLSGAGFLPGTVIDLVADNGTTTRALSVGIDATTQITATFDLTGLSVGPYGIRATLPDGTTTTLAGTFQVETLGNAHLETRLILPSAVGTHIPSTFYVEYANTGTVEMVAPILTLRSSHPNGPIQPLLTLDIDRMLSGVWTSARSEGFAYSVQIYASGATPGLLQPGERFQVPVYYIGVEPDVPSTLLELEIAVTNTDDPTPISWESMQQSLRPTWISAEAWSAVYANLQLQIGTTWGDYVRMIRENASYLIRLGQRVGDIGELYNFELQQALGYTPLAPMQPTTDAAMETPGLPLSFDRSYATTLAQRYEMSVFGRGWIVPWETHLFTENEGIIVITTSAGSQRRFQPDSRSPGRYFGDIGETGTLRLLAGGSYELRESTGQVIRFRSDGSLEYVEDRNGNRITTTFTSGRLTRLTHSNGATLTLAYNPAGRIVSITDSAGRLTSYGYDATSSYLLTVTTVAGTTSYSYNTSGPAARLHALTSVSDSTGVTQTYEYDNQGRLSGTYTSTSDSRLAFSYDGAGTVTTTDAVGGVNQVFMDHRGLVARQATGTGYYVNFSYDQARRVTRTTDALGRTQSYTYSPGGAVLSTTDTQGHTSRYLAGGPNEQPSTFIDANGNTTRYAYDAVGNRTQSTYADGSVERAAYDAQGNAIQLVNRRGQSIARTFNVAGQLTSETFHDGTSNHYTYDLRGRLATAIDPAGTTTFTHDDHDRLIRIDYPQGRFLTYQYDTAGRRTRMEDETGSVTRYAYDSSGRLRALRDGTDALIVQYTYDAAGRLAREDKGNGTWTITTYDANSRVMSVVHFSSTGLANSSFGYTYDLLDRRTSMTTPDGVWTYTYDLTSQLTRAVFTSTNLAISNQDLQYSYDALGNRTRTILNGITTDYDTNPLNQYTTVGANSLQYDRDGNLIAEVGPSGTRTYSYDSQNRLVKVKTPEGTTEYLYDAIGNRTTVVVNGISTQYTWDPFGLGDVIGEYNSAGIRTTTYTHGLGLETLTTAAGRGFYDFDALGSTIGITGAGGGYINRYAYEPYGRSILLEESIANPFQYVGAHGVTHEASGIEFMRGRFFGSALGRFLNPDPIGLAGGLNLYRYVGNDPGNFIDPSGQNRVRDLMDFVEDGSGCIGGVVATALTDGAIAPITAVPTGYACGKFLDDILPDPILGPHKPYVPQPLSEFPPSPMPAPTPSPVPNADAPPGGGGSTAVIMAIDPNEKHGAAGYGPRAFIATKSIIPYQIHFENLGPGSVPTPAQPASAPAQRVVITDALSEHLDWSTFQFTEFGFGDTVVRVPMGTRYAFHRVAVGSDSSPFMVEVELNFDASTGLVRVVFQSIDSRSQLPPDVQNGFLPPEDGTGRGKGHLTYSIRPKADLATGTEIRNVAFISFDGQPAIATNQIDPQNPVAGTDPNREALNTIDGVAPSTRVTPLPSTALSTFPVTWSGNDDPGGAGLAAFDVYVSMDGGPWIAWLTNTTAFSGLFVGEIGHSYAFASSGIDYVGNREPLSAADATTRTPLFNRTMPSLVEDSRLPSVATVRTLLGSSLTDLDPGARRGIAVTGLSGTGTWQYTLNGQIWRAMGTVSERSALLLPESASVRFFPAANYSGKANILFRGWDRTYGAAGAHIPLTPQSTTSAFTRDAGLGTVLITATNDRPVLVTGSLRLNPVALGSPVTGQSVASMGYSGSDIDNDRLGIAVTAATGPGVWHYSTDAGSTWQPFGIVSATVARLLGPEAWVRFTPKVIGGQGKLTFKIWDYTTNGGNTTVGTAFSTASQTATVMINSAPVLEPGNPLLSIIEDARANPGVLISNLLSNRVTDTVGALKGIVLTGMTGQMHGTWQYSLTNGNTWRVVGSVSEASGLLLRSTDRLRFVPNANWNGQVTATFRSWDQTAGRAGGRLDTSNYHAGATFSLESNSLILTVIPVEDRPFLNSTHAPILDPFVPGGVSSTTTVATLLGSNAADADGDPLGIGVTGITGSGRWFYSLDHGISWHTVGPFSSSSARLLADEALLRFDPDVNFTGLASITYRAWEENSTQAGSQVSLLTNSAAFSTASLVATVAVNNAPVLSTSGTIAFPSLAEDKLPNPGTLIDALLGNRVSDPNGPHAPQGVAVTSNSMVGGRWQFSLNQGLTWLDVGITSSAQALLLRSMDRLRFVPSQDWNGVATLTFRAWDQTAGKPGARLGVLMTGGATAFSADEMTATLTITPVNDPPTANPGYSDGLLWMENGASIATWLPLWVSDAEGDGMGIAITGLSGSGRWEFSTDGNVWNQVGNVSLQSTLLLEPTDRLRFVPANGFNGTAAMTFHACDHRPGTVDSHPSLLALEGFVSVTAFTARLLVNFAPELRIT